MCPAAAGPQGLAAAARCLQATAAVWQGQKAGGSGLQHTPAVFEEL